MILVTATELFLNLGFKSVTMDDIAEKLGISKKTIYAYFTNKTSLVSACTNYLFENITAEIDEIIAKNDNPIDEILAVHKFTLKRLREEKSSPQFQLKKYYPKLEKALRKKKFDKMEECVVSNLSRGIDQGFYRRSIHIDMVYRFYVLTLEGIRNSDFFPMEKYSIPSLVSNFLDYHLRGIASAKGLDYIEKITKKFEA